MCMNCGYRRTWLQGISVWFTGYQQALGWPGQSLTNCYSKSQWSKVDRVDHIIFWIIFTLRSTLSLAAKSSGHSTASNGQLLVEKCISCLLCFSLVTLIPYCSLLEMDWPSTYHSACPSTCLCVISTGFATYNSQRLKSWSIINPTLF